MRGVPISLGIDELFNGLLAGLMVKETKRFGTVLVIDKGMITPDQYPDHLQYG